jgi:hypothetical protein
MIEHILYSLFLVTFGMQIGRILTLHQQAKRTVEGITALLDSKWLGPQILAARIDQDQELIEVPHFEPSLTLRCRIIHYGVKAR